ncbi:MAG: tetratricopeptide repeat protein [Proteobacteria bacterium]|nr:tetratricopeptide repeat protein [Pseudomonadota bacterium]MBU1456520.1 tetratricopeptide repeat protein [Pseudomonadota bacterium]
MKYLKKQFFLRLLMALGFAVVLSGGFGCSGGDAEKMFQQGVDAMAADNLDEAVIWFKKAIQQNPEMTIAHYKLGELYHKKGEANLAYAELSHAVQQEPRMKEAGKELAFLLAENRALDQTILVCEQFLQVNGNDEDIYLILGNSLVYKNEYEEAVKVFEDGQKIYPENILLTLNLGRALIIKGAVKEGLALMESLALEKKDDIRVYLALAQVYEKLERFDLAVLTLEAAQEKFPEQPLPIFLLAQLSLKKNKYDKALEILLDAEKKGINDSRLYRMNAIICQQRGNSDDALKYFQKAVSAATDETRQLNQMILAEYYIYLEKYKEAQEILKIIIAEDSSKTVLKSKVIELFMAEGELEQARASVDALLKEDSSDARGHFLKGLMMMQDNNIDEAREAFSKAKDLAPNVAESQFLYGMTFREESEQISIFEISEALKKNPNLFKARLALAEIYARKGEFQQSLDELDKILANQGENNQLDKIVGKQADTITARILRIAVLVKMKKPDAALEDAEMLVEQHPDNFGHRFRLAEIYYYTGEYDKALALYEKLQEEKSESIQIVNKMVGVFMLKKDHEKAMATVDSFLAKFPDNDKAVMLKAKIYFSQGYLDLAENVLLPEADKGKNVTLIVMLAELYNLNKEVSSAVAYFQKALELAPNNIEIMMKLADLYMKSQKKEEAIESYEEVLRLKSDFLPAMNNLAFLYSEEGRDIDRALDLANTVYRKLPTNPDVADTLGWIYVMKKVYSQAEPYLQQAIGENPEHPSIIYHLAMLRYGQKQHQEAEKLLIKAIEKELSGNELTVAQDTLASIALSKEKLLEARTQNQQGNVAQAKEVLEKILNDEGFNVAAAAELAVLYAEQDQKIDQALELAKKAYAIQSTNPQVLDALGWVYYHQGTLLLAKQYLEQALKNDEGYAPARIHLGAMYLKKDDLKDARKELEKAKSMQLAAVDLQSVEEMLRKIDDLER